MEPIAPVYLDYNATTPCDPQVVEAMLPYFHEWYGNAANGLHIQGRRAARAIDSAREHVAALIGAQPHEIIFTSGATESNNQAILGLARLRQDPKRNRIVTSAVEHKAVLLPCKKLCEAGFEVDILPVDTQGRVRLDVAESVINERTLLVSVQTANNEVGTLQPTRMLAQLAHSRGAIFHADAAQSVGKIAVDVHELGVDLLAFSAHKFYGPKGVGVLYIRGGTRNIPLEPLTYGGGQEGALRSGTSNVPAIVGLGEACRLSIQQVVEESVKIGVLRAKLEQELLAHIPGLLINGHSADRLPNTSSLIFPAIEADSLLLNLPNVMMGTGSACTSGAIEPSHVLQALGLNRSEAFSTVRASLGRFTSDSDISFAASEVIGAWKYLSHVS